MGMLCDGKEPNPGGYNIVIVDELLSLLGRVTSDFMRHDDVYARLEHIMLVSPVLIFMDAFIDNRFCHQFIRHLEKGRNGRCSWVWNTKIADSNRKARIVLNRTVH